jgi:hypothetical protein
MDRRTNKRKKERKRERLTDRQTDRERGAETDRQTDREKDRLNFSFFSRNPRIHFREQTFCPAIWKEKFKLLASFPKTGTRKCCCLAGRILVTLAVCKQFVGVSKISINILIIFCCNANTKRRRIAGLENQHQIIYCQLLSSCLN